ncbi:MAG TPA: hypothetical protein VLB68_19680 [Pyrinomonadaceae bacterium]|nr:hypothetical protein [Pyrinomonadaceae bacterium]
MQFRTRSIDLAIIAIVIFRGFGKALVLRDEWNHVHAFQVTDTVAIGVFERAGIDLIDNGFFPPGLGVTVGSDVVSRAGFGVSAVVVLFPF